MLGFGFRVQGFWFRGIPAPAPTPRTTPCRTGAEPGTEREFVIDNLLVRVHIMRWTGLAPWEFEFPFPGSLTSTFPVTGTKLRVQASAVVLGQQRRVEQVPHLVTSSGFRVQGSGFRVQGSGQRLQDSAFSASDRA